MSGRAGAREAHDQSSHAHDAFICVDCEASDGAGDDVGCRHGFNHETDDFIRARAEGVSQVHASITPERDGRFLVQNLSRTNPTHVYLENVPPQGTRALPGQRVALGQLDFVLGPQWPPRAFRRGTWRLPLRGLTVQAHGRVLLDNVSLVAERSELVALMGPSGAAQRRSRAVAGAFHGSLPAGRVPRPSDTAMARTNLLSPRSTTAPTAATATPGAGAP